ncbi:MAG TPA: chemotaxis protein CheW [Abditibacteriaceae bacterium]|nr:chemotaxis protein CheW [Abditibacteriaceae bacterium]
MNANNDQTGQAEQERGVASGKETQKAILKSRAQALARVPPRESGEAQIEIVEFTLAHEHYALETLHVREVHSLRELTPLPCTPPFVLGVINVRGHIVAVLDLKKFFDLPHSALSDGSKIILIGDEDAQFGLIANAVTGVRRLELSALQPPLPTLTGIRADYLRGITSERVAVLDAAAILSDSRIVVNEEVE